MPRKRPTPPAPLRKRGPRPPRHPQQPAQIALSANWSPQISRMWMEPIEHDDDLADPGEPGQDQDHGE